MTAYTGSNSADYLYSGNWNYNWDSFYMYNGNDTVIAPTTTRTLSFYGHDGNDYFSGSYGNDYAYGGNHNDTLVGNYGKDYLNGGSGNDWLYGGAGNDTLVGDTGNDYLNGGLGQDSLYGGKSGGYDTFRVVKGDSNAAGNTADIIADWNPIYDNIDSSIRGTASNYAETSTSATNIGAARSQVEHSSTLKYEDHVFLYNASTNKGYLLSDLDGNYSFETGVIIPGASSSAWMSYSDIV